MVASLPEGCNKKTQRSFKCAVVLEVVIGDFQRKSVKNDTPLRAHVSFAPFRWFGRRGRERCSATGTPRETERKQVMERWHSSGRLDPEGVGSLLSPYPQRVLAAPLNSAQRRGSKPSKWAELDPLHLLSLRVKNARWARLEAGVSVSSGPNR